MAEKIDYSKGIYDAKQLGTPKLLILGAQHMFAMFGATVLVPLLTGWCKMEQKRAFANCAAVSYPLCALSAVIYLLRTGLRLVTALPYLVGGLAGGFVGGKLFGKVSAPWLRRIFGVFLVSGGVRYLL